MSRALRLSIVIPAYNEERYLAPCLDAIARQTEKPYEVIVVDNNSTDATAKIAQSYPFVKLIPEARQGIVFARNTGFNAASGEIIGRIDADTIINSEWSKQIIDFFASNPKSAAITGKCFFYNFPLQRFMSAIHAFIYFSIQGFIAGTQMLWGSNMAIRREVWQKVGTECISKPNQQMDEDIDLSLWLQRHKFVIERVNYVQAGVSLRRGDLSPFRVWQYLGTWHKNYFNSGLYAKGILISLLRLVLFCIVLPGSLIYWAISSD